MSGETEREPSAWESDTLHHHLVDLMNERDRRYEQRFESQQRATEAALASAKEAVSKAETAAEKRFEGVNEFRATLADQASMLMPRSETEQRMTTLTDRVNDLAGVIDRMQGRSSGVEGAWGYLIGAVGITAAVVAMVIGLR